MKFIKQLVFWTLLTVYACITEPAQERLYLQGVSVFLVMLRCMLLYTIEANFIFPRFYRQATRLLPMLAVTVILFCLTARLSVRLVMENQETGVLFAVQHFRQFLLREFILFALVSMVAGESHKRMIRIDELKMKSEKEMTLLTGELGFLKNQFNAHITFNFLNYCYNRIHKESTETAEAIEIFSKMLRYSLNNRVDEAVPLTVEVDHIEDFLRLQKLLDPEVRIEFVKNKQTYDPFYITPGVLIIFMENALSRAYLQACEDPIRIELSLSGNLLNLKIVNKMATHRHAEVLGIGQFNLKQQLELFYKDKYLLNESDDGLNYTSDLKLAIRWG